MDLQKVKATSLAATLITTGVILKNSSEQMKNAPEFMAKLGMLCFISGWAGMAWSLSIGKDKMLNFGASAAIVSAVLLMKNKMKNKEDVPMVLPIMFALGWIALGYNMNNQKLGLSAAALVLFSMLYLLPLQRAQGIVDGPGMPLFVVAWFLIIYSNSRKSFK